MTQNTGPLSGIKVVTCSTAQAGTVPYMFMADLGAHVIKIETPLLFKIVITFHISDLIVGDNPSVASSKMSKFGFVIKALPITSICCSPPDKVDAL